MESKGGGGAPPLPWGRESPERARPEGPLWSRPEGQKNNRFNQNKICKRQRAGNIMEQVFRKTNTADFVIRKALPRNQNMRQCRTKKGPDKQGPFFMETLGLEPKTSRM